jgi:hypothetical protein
MTTYKEAATAGYNRVLQLWNAGGFTGATDAFWLSGNTLRTVVLYMLTAGLKDTESFIAKRLADFASTDKNGIWLDDFGWWAIAFMLAARNSDALGLDADTRKNLVNGAITCWQTMGSGWDINNTPPVPGGIWNTQQDPAVAMQGRNCVTNEVYWLTSMQLSALTDDPSYLDPNKNSGKFFADADQKGLLFIQYQPMKVWLVCERFDETDLGFGKPGWFWAGDQGLFFSCCRWTRSPNASVFNANTADQIGIQVLNIMTDYGGILHDQVSPDSVFERDYATGKGVLIDQLGFYDAQSTPFVAARLPLFFLNNAAAVWNSRITDPNQPNLLNQFRFNWNPNGQILLPPAPPIPMPYYGGEPKDHLLGTTADCLVLQVAGLSALIQGMKVDPNAQIPS